MYPSQSLKKKNLYGESVPPQMKPKPSLQFSFLPKLSSAHHRLLTSLSHLSPSYIFFCFNVLSQGGGGEKAEIREKQRHLMQILRV